MENKEITHRKIETATRPQGPDDYDCTSEDAPGR